MISNVGWDLIPLGLDHTQQHGYLITEPRLATDASVFLLDQHLSEEVWFHPLLLGQLLQHLVDDSRYLNRFHLITSLRLFWNHS